MSFEWQHITALPALGVDELQIFRIILKDAAGSMHTLIGCLSASDIERSERLRAGQVREQFVVGRACLRMLLGNLLGIAPGDVPLILTAFGKPQLAPATRLPLYFNVAHSRDVILIALCRLGRVGVDLEHMDRHTDALELARTAFTPSEILQFEQMTDPATRQPTFFRGWTRKEAVVKADGRGLSLPLDSFEVPILEAANMTPVLVRSNKEDGETTQRWLLSDIALGEDFAAAYAIGLQPVKICGFDLTLRPASSGTSPL